MPPHLASATTLKRIHREINDLKKEDLGPMTLIPSDDNLFNWKGTIPGPQGSVYEGGIFDVDITLASDYPFTAPRVVFKTRIYHMNISEQGNICIDILKQNWSPALSLFKVMLSLSSLLTDPNPKDPLVPSIATQFVRNRQLHDSTARLWTDRHARPKPTAVPLAPPQIPITTPPSSTTSSTTSRSIPPLTVPPATSRTRGKRRDVGPAPGNPGPSTSRVVRSPPAAAAPVESETLIIVSGSDEERTSSQERGNATGLGKRKRSIQNQLEADPGGLPPVTHKRRQGPNSGAIEGTSNVPSRHEVIVIEDD
ncbi:hypothetical protein AMATHDRAFT_62851 [Amanita thiersii Skay4041]|uniref:E2 ubiquitin-conjugating enzyme n=1 Tax=Amanita thiersii Skay4041 TaxID=703135 RepID=A0A2A9NPH6_9AGAR|nr:hypothetical protein AMATHDRAFT_62851 [Amanita thiersii Skay4041]